MEPSLTSFDQYRGQRMWKIVTYIFEAAPTPEPIKMSWDLEAVIAMQMQRQVEEALKDEP